MDRDKGLRSNLIPREVQYDVKKYRANHSITRASIQVVTAFRLAQHIHNPLNRSRDGIRCVSALANPTGELLEVEREIRLPVRTSVTSPPLTVI
jgi:hypothetical protein